MGARRGIRWVLLDGAVIALAVMSSLVLSTPAAAETAEATMAVPEAAAALPACPFWAGDVTPPTRQDSPFKAPPQRAPAIDLSGRLAVPSGVTGTLSGGQVTVTFNRVAGAKAYRVWRNGQSVAWVSDWGQPAPLTVVDKSPCQHAFYTFVSMKDEGGADAAMGKLSRPYQLGDNGTVAPWSTPVGSTMTMMVTSYNDIGQTASAYATKSGICAVDPRVIPWGTYFSVPDYGTCYAADIGTWIKDATVDVWLAGSQADDWGVQHRTITILAGPP